MQNSVELLLSIKDFIASPEVFKVFAIGAFVLACSIVKKVIQ